MGGFLFTQDWDKLFGGITLKWRALKYLYLYTRSLKLQLAFDQTHEINFWQVFQTFSEAEQTLHTFRAERERASWCLSQENHKEFCPRSAAVSLWVLILMWLVAWGTYRWHRFPANSQLYETSHSSQAQCPFCFYLVRNECGKTFSNIFLVYQATRIFIGLFRGLTSVYRTPFLSLYTKTAWANGHRRCNNRSCIRLLRWVSMGALQPQTKISAFRIVAFSAITSLFRFGFLIFCCRLVFCALCATRELWSWLCSYLSSVQGYTWWSWLQWKTSDTATSFVGSDFRQKQSRWFTFQYFTLLYKERPDPEKWQLSFLCGTPTHAPRTTAFYTWIRTRIHWEVQYGVNIHTCGTTVAISVNWLQEPMISDHLTQETK